MLSIHLLTILINICFTIILVWPIFRVSHCSHTSPIILLVSFVCPMVLQIFHSDDKFRNDLWTHHNNDFLRESQVLTPKHAFFAFTYASKNAFHYEITGYRKRHTEFSDFRRSLKRKRTLPWISNGLLLFCTRQRRREIMSRSWLHSWSTFYQGWNTNALGVADTRW